MLFVNLFLFSQDNFVHSIQFSSTYLIILHSQSNKLLEHIQNIRIQILSEEQCLQGGTIFFHLFMVHHEYLLKSSNCPTVPEIDVLFDGKFVIYIKLLFRFHGKIVSLKNIISYQGVLKSIPSVSQRRKCSDKIIMNR